LIDEIKTIKNDKSYVDMSVVDLNQDIKHLEEENQKLLQENYELRKIVDE
jgi:regulator of replication initiation timing